MSSASGVVGPFASSKTNRACISFALSIVIWFSKAEGIKT